MKTTLKNPLFEALIITVLCFSTIVTAETTLNDSFGDRVSRRLNIDENTKAVYPLGEKFGTEHVVGGSSMSVRGRCTDLFIKKDLSYGEAGEIIKKEITGLKDGKSISSSQSNAFFSDKQPQGMEKVCKGYYNMSNPERLNFWVLTLAAIAKDESGCRPTAKNDKAGPRRDGIAVGLYQTPLSEEGKNPEWRGEGCKVPPPYESVEHQTKCAVEIMRGLLTGKYHKDQPTSPFEPGSYWAVAMATNNENKAKRDKGQDTLAAIKEFPPCKN